jgi:uncharacterized protein (TIGR02246 family)
MSGDEQLVRDALTALDEAFERLDLEAVLNLCTEDVIFIGSGIGEEALGREAIGPMFASLAPHLEGGFEWSLSWDSIDVDVLGDAAILLGFGNARLVTAHRNAHFRYRLTGLLVRSGDQWLWRLHHGSEPGAW